ncbi:MAG: hypothetical protein QG583_137 [Patescibacteria group bacterium]|nr:hypothetical protein [Patescibacteria group bacterium]
MNNFFGSKLKAILWLIIGVLLVLVIYVILYKNDIYFGRVCDDGQGHSPDGAELERCLERHKIKRIFGII